MRNLLFAVACALCLSAVVGCNNGQQSDGDGSGAKLTIAVIPKSTGGEFWTTVEEGATAAAKELGVNMKWQGTLTEDQIVEQKNIVESMVNLGVDGIALAPLNPKAMEDPVQQAVDAGIPVVIFDSAVDGDAYVSFVATQNKGGGELGGKELVRLLGDKKGAKVMLMRFVSGTASTEERAEGFLEVANNAGLDVVSDIYADQPTPEGCKVPAANALNMFVVDDKLTLDGIFACNEKAALGVQSALSDLRKSGVEVNVKFVGFDSSPKLLEGLQDGEIDALVVQNPRKMGELAVKTLVAYLRGEKVEKFIDTGVELVTAERLKSDAALRKLLGVED